MSRVKGRDTRPELYVRRALWSAGFRYRLHRKDLPGGPDIVLAKYRIAVFVHGCFWHQHDCPRAKRPASNVAYWNRKLDGNLERDGRNLAQLEKMGWRVIVLWECELRSATSFLLDILQDLNTRSREKRP